MIQLDPAALLRTLNRSTTQALENAAGVALSRGHYEVKVEHLLSQLLIDPNADIYLIFRHFGFEAEVIDRALSRQLEAERSGNSGRPLFSPLLLKWISDGWLLASVDYRSHQLRGGALLVALLLEPYAYTTGSYVDLLADIPRDELRKGLVSIASGSIEAEEAGGFSASATQAADKSSSKTGPHSRGPESALGRFTLDFTARARSGKLDPVIGREVEIRQCIDILARRRKNNPILVGEAGVGKSALVEGIAQRIVKGEVPRLLREIDLLGLDLGLLQAGASVKGEFENRLKGVIEEVQASERPIVLFIDEAHTIIGAGGQEGGSDAANLLKPALARGELRTIAATTWSEYKKYFEKDAALSRRFQRVRVEEPSLENATAMMRGLAPFYEDSHGVRLRDAGVVAAVELSSRYISGRQLPDKAVDLLDTCAARVAIAQDSQPGGLEDIGRQIEILERERSALGRELEEHDGDPKLAERITELERELEESKSTQSRLTEEWKVEKEVIDRIRTLRGAKVDGVATPDSQALNEALAELGRLQQERALVPLEVSPDLVAQVVSDWTGIPAGKMVRDQAALLLGLEDHLEQRIKGQGSALRALGEGIRASKLELGSPSAPMGVFLLVGPSGVGKTETGLALADLLFGGERFVITINMSEFQEKHTVSRLIGSPPGYVGYGEGGVLTEAVRQRPYSAVVLDEVEKADPEVMNLFYQVFDKGQLADGEGRIIDFRNTVILMTSNLGSQETMALCQQVPPPKRSAIASTLRPLLAAHFKPALLARMTVVPYFPLSADAMRAVCELKLDRLKERMRETHRIVLDVDEAVVERILARCAEVESGARNIDHIMSRTLLPMVSRALLDQMVDEKKLPSSMRLAVEDGEFALVL